LERAGGRQPGVVVELAVVVVVGVAVVVVVGVAVVGVGSAVSGAV